MTAIFLFRWRHRDGSIIEFSERGWTSDDPKKCRWLIQMSELFSSSPALTPRIKVWLKNNCRLIGFHRSRRIKDTRSEIRKPGGHDPL